MWSWFSAWDAGDSNSAEEHTEVEKTDVSHTPPGDPVPASRERRREGDSSIFGQYFNFGCTTNSVSPSQVTVKARNAQPGRRGERVSCQLLDDEPRESEVGPKPANTPQLNRNLSYQVRVHSESLNSGDEEQQGLEMEAVKPPRYEIDEATPKKLNGVGFSEDAAAHLREELASYMKKQERAKSRKSKKEERHDLKNHLKKSLETYLAGNESKETAGGEKELEKKAEDMINSAVYLNTEANATDQKNDTKDATQKSKKKGDSDMINSGVSPNAEINATKRSRKYGDMLRSGIAKAEANDKKTSTDSKHASKKGDATKATADSNYATKKSKKKGNMIKRAVFPTANANDIKAKFDSKDAAKKSKKKGGIRNSAIFGKVQANAKAKADSRDAISKNQRTSDENCDNKKDYPEDKVLATLGDAKDQEISGVQATSGENVLSVLESHFQAEYDRLEEMANGLDEETKRLREQREAKERGLSLTEDAGERETRKGESISAANEHALDHFLSRAAREARELEEAAEKAQKKTLALLNTADREAHELEEAAQKVQKQTEVLLQARRDEEKKHQYRDDEPKGRYQAKNFETQESHRTMREKEQDQSHSKDDEDSHNDKGQDASSVGSGSSAELFISQKQQGLRGEIADEMAKLQVLQDDFIQKVQVLSFDEKHSSILKSDIFSKTILRSASQLKAQTKRHDEHFQIQRQLSQLRKEQTELFAKSHELINAE